MLNFRVLCGSFEEESIRNPNVEFLLKCSAYPISVHFLERPRKRTKRSRPVSRFFLRFSKRADSLKLASLKQSKNLIAPFCDAQRVTMGRKKQLRLLITRCENPFLLKTILVFNSASTEALVVIFSVILSELQFHLFFFINRTNIKINNYHQKKREIKQIHGRSEYQK